jgi:hypothetical protein
MVNIDFPAIKQVLFNAVGGGIVTWAAGSLGTHLVRYLQGQAFHEIKSNHPVFTCTKVMMIVLPLWYLYKRYAEERFSYPINKSAFEIISLGTVLGVIKFSQTQVTPLLSLALALTHLSWKIFAATETGLKLLFAQT